MQKLIWGLIVAGLMVLASGEAFARGPRGGPRGGGPTSTPRPPISSPGQHLGPGGPSLGSPAGARLQISPAVTGTGGGARVNPQSLQGHLGIEPPSGEVRGNAQAAYGHWTATHPEPFSPAWYAQHPNVWQATHPYAVPAAVATTTALAAWLAVPVVPVVVSGSSESGEVSVEQPSGDTATAPADPAALAQSGAAPVPDDTQWLPLGVFNLGPSGEERPTRVVELAVSPGGILRGTHFDLLSDATETIHGAVDKQAQRAAWSVGADGGVVFQAPLVELAKPAGQWTAVFPDGRSSPWQTRQTSR